MEVEAGFKVFYVVGAMKYLLALLKETLLG